MKETLSNLSIGKKAIIKGFSEYLLENTKLNLLEMGIFEEQVIEKIQEATFSDPCIYSIQGRKVAFRNYLSERIQIEEI